MPLAIASMTVVFGVGVDGEVIRPAHCGLLTVPLGSQGA